MPTVKYNKLIRDKMPEIIAAKGGSSKTHVADEAEYKEKLKRKMLEEFAEWMKEEDAEGMADVFEVITAILAVYGWNIEQIVEIQKKKREERGGFEKRLVLDEKTD